MRAEDKTRKHKEITEVAYALLDQHGYAGCSMLRIAKAAKASNETLYRWYGSKDGLFETMVRDNAAETRAALEEALAQARPPIEALRTIGPIFLAMLCGQKAVALNRAAAADATGALGAALSKAGREEVFPLFAALITPLCDGGDRDPGEVTGLYLSLLIGDWQIKRVAHHAPEPQTAEIAQRCERALRDLCLLLG